MQHKAKNLDTDNVFAAQLVATCLHMSLVFDVGSLVPIEVGSRLMSEKGS